MSITPILQFGTSRFLQAHADLFISEAMQQGQAIGPITVVQSSGNVERARRLAALAHPGGYRVRIEGLVDGAPVREETIVTSIARAMSTGSDWEAIGRIFVEEVEIVLSNTGDQGYLPMPADEKPTYDQAMSFPAKLALLLEKRFLAGGKPLQIMPTELIACNGHVLRQHVLTSARRHSDALADWIASDVIFVNSLVDRIVSEPLEPAGAVAEPYALWAIERSDGLKAPCTHPSVQIVDDLGPIERRKLYILNLGHTYLVGKWLQSDRQAQYVRDLMEDPVARADLEQLYREEVLPVFQAVGDVEAEAYVATTLDRFANPYLAHKLADIAQNHSQKLERRIVAFMDWAKSKGVSIAQPRLEQVLKSSA